MFRLPDSRAGSYTVVRPARPGLLRACVHVPETAGATDITWLRVLLVADLLLRAAEMRNMQVLTILVFAAPSDARMQAVKHAADAISIHPATAYMSLPEAHASSGGPIDVHVVNQGAGRDEGWGGLITSVGTAQIQAAGDHSAAMTGALAGTADPLTVRLALMSVPYQKPADLTEGVLNGADATLARWRHHVAHWAESPSRPLPGPISAAARNALADLDTVSVIGLLHDLVRDADTHAGAKFETFVYADRFLALDLPRDIGKARS
jgi:hypothetical protein